MILEIKSFGTKDPSFFLRALISVTLGLLWVLFLGDPVAFTLGLTVAAWLISKKIAVFLGLPGQPRIFAGVYLIIFSLLTAMAAYYLSPSGLWRGRHETLLLLSFLGFVLGLGSICFKPIRRAE